MERTLCSLSLSAGLRFCTLSGLDSKGWISLAARPQRSVSSVSGKFQTGVGGPVGFWRLRRAGGHPIVGERAGSGVRSACLAR